MASKNKKQAPGIYQRWSTLEQKYEQRANRALRRKDAARTRRFNSKKRAEYRYNLKHYTTKASRLFEKGN